MFDKWWIFLEQDLRYHTHELLSKHISCYPVLTKFHERVPHCSYQFLVLTAAQPKAQIQLLDLCGTVIQEDNIISAMAVHENKDREHRHSWEFWTSHEV